MNNTTSGNRVSKCLMLPILLKRSYSDKSNNPPEETFELEIESIIKKINKDILPKSSEYVDKIKDVTLSNQYTIKSKYRNDYISMV